MYNIHYFIVRLKKTNALYNLNIYNFCQSSLSSAGGLWMLIVLHTVRKFTQWGLFLKAAEDPDCLPAKTLL